MSGDWLIGLGIVLVVIGPLFNVPVIWVVHRLFVSRLVQRAPLALSEKGLKLLSVTLAAGLVFLVLFVTTLPGNAEFQDLCTRLGEPEVKERHFVDSLYADKLFPYEASRLLMELDMAFVEAPDPYREGIYVRYSLDADGQLVTGEIDQPVSRFEARKRIATHIWGSSSFVKTISDRRTGELIAQAASVDFDGGPLSLLLGNAFTQHCPDILTEQGSDRFRIFYNLEAHVLRFTE